MIGGSQRFTLCTKRQNILAFCRKPLYIYIIFFCNPLRLLVYYLFFLINLFPLSGVSSQRSLVHLGVGKDVV